MVMTLNEPVLESTIPPNPADMLAKTLCRIKRDLALSRPTAQIAEAIPAMPSDEFLIPRDDLQLLHRFASENPIYRDSHESVLHGIRCIVYEGDANKYWLGSILHEASRAPFSPTWIASAYVLARLVKGLGYRQVIDVGSGDGRIAFCASVLGMDAHGIEIDAELVGLQERLSHLSSFEAHCADATEFDYVMMSCGPPAVVFVGGLAQMGGDIMASGIMDRLAAAGRKMPGWVFAGTMSPKYASDPEGMHGWGKTMRRAGLRHAGTVALPSAWTFNQTDDTQYVFASKP